MSLKFDGDVVIVTGAAGGLGRAHSLLLSELGARVIVNDTGGVVDGRGGDPQAAARVVQEIEARGGSALADTNDGSTVEGAQAMIASALEKFGRIDAVIANAGILRDKTFHNVSDEDFFAVLNVHLTGTVRVLHAAYPHMREQGYGRIVTTTSAAGLFGNFGQTSYAAAKMGIVGFSKSLAQEAAKKNIKVNTIAPTAATRMTAGLMDDFSARLQPNKVSPLAAYLCHPSLEATGQVFSVGGGRFARVAVGVTPGIFQDNPDIDFVANGFDDILTDERFIYPDNAMGEMPLVLAEH
jgi:NAD(P)-dependent dehydrogenase (short-subunit alcohol dehydrogenase family)